MKPGRKAEITWGEGDWGWNSFVEMKLGYPADCAVHFVSLPLTAKGLPHVEGLLAQSQISVSFGIGIMMSCLF